MPDVEQGGAQRAAAAPQSIQEPGARISRTMPMVQLWWEPDQTSVLALERAETTLGNSSGDLGAHDDGHRDDHDDDGDGNYLR